MSVPIDPSEARRRAAATLRMLAAKIESEQRVVESIDLQPRRDHLSGKVEYEIRIVLIDDV